MYFTLPPGRAIRTGNSRVEWLALLTFLCCTVWSCRSKRRHALCILIARYFHEHIGTDTWVWPAGALIAITISTAAATYTTQRAAPLYNKAKNQHKYHLSNYNTTLSTLSQFHPYSTLTISPTQILQVLPSTFQFYKCLFPRQCPTDILYELLSFPTWRYMQPVTAFKLSLFRKCWVTSIEHHASCYVKHFY